MSPDAPGVEDGKTRGYAFAASLACLAAMVLVSVFPGWVIAGF